MALPFASFKYLVADGTYLKHENCIYAVTDCQSGLVVAHGYGTKECYLMAYSIFSAMKAKGCDPKAVTIDGNIQVIRALREVWPQIMTQRCLYHILRQGTSWLRRFPGDPSARELRNLVLTVTNIHDRQAMKTFVDRFAAWEKQYGPYVSSLDSRNKVWGDLQRTRSLLIHAMPNMFHYLDDPCISPTSNQQEGRFSIAKIVFRNHRGVSKQNRASYFRWYFYFKNQQITNSFGY